MALALGAVVVSGCFDLKSSHGQEPGRARLLIARATIPADTGGIVATADPDAPHAGVRLEIPPGALAEDTDVSLYLRLGDPRLPQVVQAVEVEPRGLELAKPATIVVDYGPFYEQAFGSLWSETEIQLFSFVDDPRDDARFHEVEFRDTDRHLVRAKTTRFGSFFAVNPDVRRLALRRPRLVDPATPIPATPIDGRTEAIAQGTEAVSVGRGSLASFWASPATRNLLIVHGLGDDAIGVSNPGSVAPTTPNAAFNQDFENVVVFEYASARSLVEAGRQLYDDIRHGAGEGFGTRVLAHGTGGLVVRYALELAQGDRSRPGAKPTDPALDQWIDRVVFVATPHLGSQLVVTRFADLLQATELDDAEFVAGLLDLVPGSGGLVDWLAREPHPVATRYFAIAGDYDGRDDDGLVDVTSALALPSWVTGEAYQVFSGPLYNHLLLTALADRSGVVAQSRVWLDKRRDNERPVVGSVATPDGAAAPTVRIQFTLSDPEQDDCLVTAEYSLDGLQWHAARDAHGHDVAIVLPSAEAPGRANEVAFSTAGSGIGVYTAIPVRLRIKASDPFGEGTAGETGVFMLSPFAAPGAGGGR